MTVNYNWILNGWLFKCETWFIAILGQKNKTYIVFNGVYFLGVMGSFLWYRNYVCKLILVCFDVFGYILRFGKVQKIA